METTKPKILLLDLETSPLLSYTWETYETDVVKVVEDWYLLCFGYKWLGEKSVHVESLKHGRKSEKELVKKLWNIFNEADIIVAHNLVNFDWKKSNAKFIEYGLTPPRPAKRIDTLKEARKYFKFTSSRLDALGELLEVGRKVKHPGFEMWEGFMAGDKKYIKLMEKYNKGDVVLLEKVYLKLRPWMKHPNLNVLTLEDGCPNCGSLQMQNRGFSITSRGRRRRVQCQSCGAWASGELEEHRALIF